MTTTPALDSPTIPFSTAVAALSSAQPAPSAAAPPAAPPTVGEMRLNERIDAVLRGAIEGLGFTAAELRLVDNQAERIETSHHQAATDWEFEPTATTPLSEAAGELAAMSGAAVVLEDARALEDWEISRSVGAAFCVPVASDTAIHGALWFYSDQPMTIEQPQLQLAEIIAGRLAVEYERHWLLDQERHRGTSTRRAPSPRRAVSPGRRSVVHTPATPSASPRIDTPTVAGAEVAGMADDRLSLHLERRLADGRVMLATAAIIDSPGMSQQDAAGVRRALGEAIDRHANHAADAGQLLTAIGQHVWRNTTGGDAVSMAVALVDDETGDATVALAGDAAGLCVQASRRTPLATDLPPIGWDEDACYEATHLEMAVRERLVLAIGAARQTGEETADQMASGFKPATADEHRRMTAGETLARASAAPLTEGAPLLAVSVLRRG